MNYYPTIFLKQKSDFSRKKRSFVRSKMHA